MQFTPLASVRHRVKVGTPVPFNIRNADQALLLARGQVVHSESQLDALFERGALVDSEELRSPGHEVHDTPADRLPALWGSCMDRVGRLLRGSTARCFADALDEAARPVLA